MLNKFSSSWFGYFFSIRWTGSNANPLNNDGQGRAGSDRHNIAVLRPQAFLEGTPGIAVPVKLKHGQWGMNIPDCLCNSTFLGMSYADRNLLVISGNTRKFDKIFGGESLETLIDFNSLTEQGPTTLFWTTFYESFKRSFKTYFIPFFFNSENNGLEVQLQLVRSDWSL